MDKNHKSVVMWTERIFPLKELIDKEYLIELCEKKEFNNWVEKNCPELVNYLKEKGSWKNG